jgi:hypothetical protein
MTSIDFTQVEQHPNGKLVYSVRVHSAEGRIEFPIVVQDVGTTPQNEAAILQSMQHFAQELTEAAQLRLEGKSL